MYGLKVYRFLVELYTKRQLSYPSDILNAFAGIGKALEERYGGQMVQGLREAVLNLALLWTPKDIAIRRRKSLPSEASQQIFFPSLGWSGWIGSVDFTLPIFIMQASKPGKTSLRVEIGMLSLGSQSHYRLVNKKVGSDFI